MSARIDNDAYQTPVKTVQSILPFIDFRGDVTFLEPCRGEGNIYDSIDIPIANKFWCEIDDLYHDVDIGHFCGKNYLETEYLNVDLIITNPPFSLWREFLEKSLSEADTVIYLLRLNTLGSGVRTKRKDFWNANRPSHLFPLQERPSFTGNGTDSTDYAWFVFDRTNRIKTKELITVL